MDNPSPSTFDPLHKNDAGKVGSFLSNVGDGVVEIREHERCALFVTQDGGVLGVTRWQYDFPSLKVGHAVKCEFEVDAGELKRQISFLTSAGKKGDPRLTFKYDTDTGLLALEVDSAFASKVGRTTLELVSQDGMDKFPANGFTLNYTYVNKIQSHFGNESLKMGVNWTDRNGWVIFQNERGDDGYLTVVVWLK